MKLRLLFLFTIMAFYSHAQTAGIIDANFGVSGTATFTPHKNLYPYGISVEPYTGEIAAVGQYKSGSMDVGFIARYDFYGNPRTAFGNNGVLELSDLSTTNQALYDVVFVNPGSSTFIVKGSYKNASNVVVAFYRKYLANGTLDTSYGVGGTLTLDWGEIHGNYIYSIGTNSVTAHQYFKRYHLADGTLDATFNNGDFPFANTYASYNISSQYNTINIQADGSIVLCGAYHNSGNYEFVGRYDSTGHLDTNFGVNGYYIGGPTISVWQTATQTDGKIVCLLSSGANAGSVAITTRLNSNGALDTNYGTGGYGYHTFSNDGNFLDKMLMQSDNKILICGSEVNLPDGTSSLYLTRVNTSGTQDFWRADMQSPYSENWSMTKIVDSYGLTFGQTSDASFTIWTPIIQRVFLKDPLISLYVVNGSSDTTMSTTDNTNYTLSNVALPAGGVKFRLDHDWAINWGAAAVNPFPTATATMGLGDIIIPNAGNYNVSFNIKTGQYSFIQLLNTQQQAFVKPVLYPNPATSILQFQANYTLDNIIVSSIDGKKIIEISDSNQIDVENLANGIYLIQGKLGEHSFTERFIKK